MHVLDNPNQNKAVTHGEGPALVLAGPGTGKTYTITHHILFLTDKLKVNPESILAITFTREAAEELRRRIPSQYNIKAGTFHSIFYEYIRSHGHTKRKIADETVRRHIISMAANGSADPDELSDFISLYKSGCIDQETIAGSPKYRKLFEKEKLYDDILKSNDLLDFCEIFLRDFQAPACYYRV